MKFWLKSGDVTGGEVWKESSGRLARFRADAWTGWSSNEACWRRSSLRRLLELR
jgi:hypothetical protein